MHRKVGVCALATGKEFMVVERFPRLSWELSQFWILVFNLAANGYKPLTAWTSPYDLNEWIEYTISEEKEGDNTQWDISQSTAISQ